MSTSDGIERCEHCGGAKAWHMNCSTGEYSYRCYRCGLFYNESLILNEETHEFERDENGIYKVDTTELEGFGGMYLMPYKRDQVARIAWFSPFEEWDGDPFIEWEERLPLPKELMDYVYDPQESYVTVYASGDVHIVWGDLQPVLYNEEVAI